MAHRSAKGGRPATVTEAQITKIRALRAAGFTIQQVMREVGVTENQVKWWVRPARTRGPGTNAPGAGGRPRTVTDEQVDEMRRLRAEGVAKARVADMMGVSPSTVARYAPVPAGATPRRGTVDSDGYRARLSEAERMLRDERSGYAIASEVTGVSVGALKHHFPGLGWTAQEVGSYAELSRRLDDLKLELRKD